MNPTASGRLIVYAPFEPGYCGEARAAIDAVYKAVVKEIDKLKAQSVRKLRANDGLNGLRENAKRIERTMVGATGIEPVTPTMSR
jgi:hypothetical protein